MIKFWSRFTAALLCGLPLSAAATIELADPIVVTGGQLNVSLSRQVSRAQQQKIIRWLTSAADAVTTTYGQFPLASVDVLITPTSRGDGPVPFGQVMRAGGTRVRLLANITSPIEALITDWTAVHEFSHLMLPYIDRDAAWLSEGIATYYQYLLRVRAGLIDEEEAWRGILAGIERGRKDTQDDQTLRQVSTNMSRRGGYMRVYWSGLVYALTTDVLLRQGSGGVKSLDAGLQAFRDCCLPTQDSWTAAEFLSQLDQLLDTQEFTAHYHDYPRRRDFPAVDTTLTDLGVSFHGGKLKFIETAPKAALRRQIMTAPEQVARTPEISQKQSPELVK